MAQVTSSTSLFCAERIALSRNYSNVSVPGLSIEGYKIFNLYLWEKSKDHEKGGKQKKLENSQ
jgi:hypothetical protein